MATRAIVVGDTVLAVYDDRWRDVLESIGPLRVERATEVEYEDGQWVARLCATSQEIARGRVRAAVIAAEIQYLEGVLSEPYCANSD